MPETTMSIVNIVTQNLANSYQILPKSFTFTLKKYWITVTKMVILLVEGCVRSVGVKK